MTRKIVATAILVSLLLVGGSLLLQNDELISEAQLREKFRRDRITADDLATDIYCQNPEYYYQDIQRGAAIDDSDFDDPRYRALYE